VTHQDRALLLAINAKLDLLLERVDILGAPRDPAHELVDALTAWATDRPFTADSVIAAAHSPQQQRLSDALEAMGVSNGKELAWRLRPIVNDIGGGIVFVRRSRLGKVYRARPRGIRAILATEVA
jgi:hypothetical protein